MKTATIKQRRTHRDGRRLVNVLCPACQHRHWMPETTEPVRCPLKIGKQPFTIAGLTS
jgi:hypothetical protein